MLFSQTFRLNIWSKHATESLHIGGGLTKRVWIIVLGVLNLIACANMLALLGIFCYAIRIFINIGFVFSWGLPFIAVAVFTLIVGIRTLRGGNWIWAVFAPILTGAAWLYLYFFAAITQTYLPI